MWTSFHQCHLQFLYQFPTLKREFIFIITGTTMSQIILLLVMAVFSATNMGRVSGAGGKLHLYHHLQSLLQMGLFYHWEKTQRQLQKNVTIICSNWKIRANFTTFCGKEKCFFSCWNWYLLLLGAVYRTKRAWNWKTNTILTFTTFWAYVVKVFSYF